MNIVPDAPAEEVLETMTKAERSLLLYLEDRCVNHGGMVCGAHMNAEDLALADRWADEKFVRFSRLLSKYLGKDRFPLTHVSELSERAWACAGVERMRRANRAQSFPEVGESLKHFENLGK